MKKSMLVLMLLICFFNTTLLSQVTQEELDKARQEASQAIGSDKQEKQKAYESLLEKVRGENAIKAIKANDFVLEANKVNFKGGQWKFVTATTNFISLSGDKATIQIAFDGAPPGPNGLGGITLEGSVSNVVIKTDKKGNTRLSMNVNGIGISARVDIQLPKDGHNAVANVSPNFSSNHFTLTGYLWPRTESKVFKGRAL